MIKCPNCGSSAQPKPIDYQIAQGKYQLNLEITYKCGCGRLFVTQAPIRLEDEIIIDPNV